MNATGPFGFEFMEKPPCFTQFELIVSRFGPK